MRGKPHEIDNDFCSVGASCSFDESSSKTEDLLAKLKVEVHNKKNKNVEVIQLAEQITRKMHGK